MSCLFLQTKTTESSEEGEFDAADVEQRHALFRLLIHMKAYFAQRSNGKRPKWPPVLDKITKEQTGIAYL